MQKKDLYLYSAVSGLTLMAAGAIFSGNILALFTDRTLRLFASLLFFPFLTVLALLPFLPELCSEHESAASSPGINPAFYAPFVSMALGGVNQIMKYLCGSAIQEQPLINIIASSSWLTFALLAAITLSVAPACEELLFRHICFNAADLNCRIPRTAKIIIVSAAFALFHGIMLQTLSLFFAGIFFQHVYLKKGYLSAVLAHSLFNLTSVIGIAAYKLMQQ